MEDRFPPIRPVIRAAAVRIEVPREMRVSGGHLQLRVTKQIPDHREALAQCRRPRRASGGGSADGRRSRTQDGGDRPGIDLKVAQELIQGDAVLNPVEELLDGKARTAETGHTAHACGIDPYGFCKLHGRISASFKCLHGRSGVCGRINTEEDRLGGGGVQ